MEDVLRSPRCLIVLVLSFGIPLTFAQVNVTTYHNDNSRTGQNAQETALTTSNVAPSTFGKLFSVTVDGQIYAQPLVVSNVSIGGGTHNVVFVATENGSVYALDANTGHQYWQVSLGTPVSTSSINCPDISPQYGITSTPAIDPSTNLLYVVALNGSSYQLRALSIATGSTQVGPVTVAGSYDGKTFYAGDQHIRTALLLENGNIIFGSGSHCDNNTWYGWVFSYNASTLQQNGIFNTEPGGNCAGVWMSGNGVAADSSGDLYFSTGNSEEYLKPNYGDSILKLSPPSSGFSVLDYFTPYLANYYGSGSGINNKDLDVGSGGVMLLPGTSLLVQVGKAGVLYLVNTTTNFMGEYCGTCLGGDTNIVQELPNATVGLWGSPAYWNGYVYFGSAREKDSLGGATADTMKAYSFNAGGSGKLSTGATSVTGPYSWPSPTPSVSSNGTSNGIVWALDNSGTVSAAAILHAYQATNLGLELYNSNQAPSRDAGGGPIKFTVPTIANGKVYVGGAGSTGSNGQLTVYGLGPQPVAVLLPSTINFGTVDFSHGPVNRIATLTNYVTSTITIGSEYTLYNDLFSVTGTTCGSTLAAGANCSITVTLTPGNASGAGTASDTLNVADSAPNSPQQVPLSATITCLHNAC